MSKVSIRWAKGAAVVVAVAGAALLMGPTHSTSNPVGQFNAVTGPLILRGFTEAPAGTVMLAADPGGGALLLELRVSEGQRIKRGDIIAVLSNYPRFEAWLRDAESRVEKMKLTRETMQSGFRTTLIAMQEGNVRLVAEQAKLKAIELARSDKPREIKQLELSISQRNLEIQQAWLRVMKETLNKDLAVADLDIKILEAGRDNLRIGREQALVRSPIDGVVVQIYSRLGEMPSGRGIVKIVDFSKLNVFADIDDLHLGRVTVGGRVEVSFVGSRSIYNGKVARVAQVVKSLQETDDHGSVAVHSIEVEIELDNPSDIPQFLGREAHVTFL